jgi:hypothetical protein
MKTHHLIFLVTAMFVVLFYDQEPGLNIGILGILVAVLTYFNTEKRFKTSTFYSVLATSILSSMAFAWYGDFASFLAIFTSLFLLGFTSKNKELKSILVIPVFAINFVTFIYRVFQLEQWLPQRKTESFWQKILAVVLIPAFLLLIFFAIYTHGSSHFSTLTMTRTVLLNTHSIFPSRSVVNSSSSLDKGISIPSLASNTKHFQSC